MSSRSLQKRRPRRILPALLVIVSALAGAVVAELFLRLCFPLFGVVLGPHPRYLHVLVPNSRQVQMDDLRAAWPFHSVRINAAGHWGPEEPDGDPAPRVVVYGDSFIDSHYAPIEESYPVRLAAHLNRLLVHPVKVINAGVFGYGPDQESLRIEDDLARSRPALIVVSLFAGNDFGDLLRNKLFRLGPDGSAVATRRIVGAEAWDHFQEIGPLHLGRAVLALRWRVAALRRSWLESGPDDRGARSEAFVRKALEARRREYQSFVVDGDDVIRELFDDGYDLDLRLFPEEPPARYKKALMAAVLDRIAAIARAGDVPLLLLVIPAPIDVAQDWPIVIDRSLYGDYRESAVTDFLEAQARRLGIPCVNLFEPFDAADGTPFYRPAPDEHWSRAGMDLAAQRTAECIVSERLLSQREGYSGVRGSK